MPIYGSDPITFDGISGHRYWFHEPFNFTGDRYNLTDTRLALFGVSMGVLQTAFVFSADGIGERLLGTIGHADLTAFAKSWGNSILPDLAASPLGLLAEALLGKSLPAIKSMVPVLRMVKRLKYADECGRACNPMTYFERVNPLRPVRFLIGECDPLVNVAAAQACASQFPDGACYVVPGMGHGTTRFGPSFCDHVRYFLATQLGDWRE